MGVGVYFGTQCYSFALKCLFVYIVIQETRPYLRESVIYFIYMQPRKMKFTFVQINMKQVS